MFREAGEGSRPIRRDSAPVLEFNTPTSCCRGPKVTENGEIFGQTIVERFLRCIYTRVGDRDRPEPDDGRNRSAAVVLNLRSLNRVLVEPISTDTHLHRSTCAWTETTSRTHPRLTGWNPCRNQGGPKFGQRPTCRKINHRRRCATFAANDAIASQRQMAHVTCVKHDPATRTGRTGLYWRRHTPTTLANNAHLLHKSSSFGGSPQARCRFHAVCLLKPDGCGSVHGRRRGQQIKALAPSFWNWKLAVSMLARRLTLPRSERRGNLRVVESGRYVPETFLKTLSMFHMQ